MKKQIISKNKNTKKKLFLYKKFKRFFMLQVKMVASNYLFIKNSKQLCVFNYLIKKGNLCTFLRAIPVPRATALNGSSQT